MQSHAPWSDGGPGRSRTADQRFRKPLLYPTELRGQCETGQSFSGFSWVHKTPRNLTENHAQTFAMIILTTLLFLHAQAQSGLIRVGNVVHLALTWDVARSSPVAPTV